MRKKLFKEIYDITNYLLLLLAPPSTYPLFCLCGPSPSWLDLAGLWASALLSLSHPCHVCNLNCGGGQ